MQENLLASFEEIKEKIKQLPDKGFVVGWEHGLYLAESKMKKMVFITGITMAKVFDTKEEIGSNFLQTQNGSKEPVQIYELSAVKEKEMKCIDESIQFIKSRKVGE